MCSFTLSPITFALAVLLSQAAHALPQPQTSGAASPTGSTYSSTYSSTPSPYSSTYSTTPYYSTTTDNEYSKGTPYYTTSSYPSKESYPPSGSGCPCYATPTPYPPGDKDKYDTSYSSSDHYPASSSSSCSCYSSTYSSQPSYTSSPYTSPKDKYPPNTTPYPYESPSPYTSPKDKYPPTTTTPYPYQPPSPYTPPKDKYPPTTTPYPKPDNGNGTYPEPPKTSPSSPATLRATFDTTFDNKSGSLNNVACSNGANGLAARFPTFGDIPKFPFIGGAFDVVWNSPNCGSCWSLTNPATGVSINLVAVDTAGSGFNIAQEAFVQLNGGQIGQGVLDVVASKVAPSVCGL